MCVHVCVYFPNILTPDTESYYALQMLSQQIGEQINSTETGRAALNQFSEHVIPVTDRIKEGAYVLANDVQDRLNRSEVAHKVIHQTLNPKNLSARP